MIYLNEQELGFDPNGLGFPSLDGCQAIVFTTENGLYGMHNFGGADQDSWAIRAKMFGDFFDDHFLRGGVGSALYGVCYATTSRGYGVDKVKSKWKGELSAFAKAVGYKGKIWGYNLDLSGIPASAYVEFRKAGTACTIWAKKWNDADRTKGNNSATMHHKCFAKRKNAAGTGYVTQVEALNKQVVLSVTTTGLAQFQPEKL